MQTIDRWVGQGECSTTLVAARGSGGVPDIQTFPLAQRNCEFYDFSTQRRGNEDHQLDFKEHSEMDLSRFFP